MIRTVFAVGRIRGVEVRVHLSWVLIAALLVVGVGGDLLPAISPESPAALDWLVGGLVAFLTFLSVAAHELAHALVGQRVGIPVSSVTLYFFGGPAAMESEAAGPGEEIRAAAAGPLASFALAALSIAVGVAADAIGGSHATLVSLGAAILAAFNALLGLVNLVPGFPLDGGRIVRAVIWQASGDERRATRIASIVGRVVGAGMVFGGFLLALYGAAFEGLGVILCGWLLGSASRTLERRAILEELVADISVGEAMERDVQGVPPQLTLDTFADELLARGPGSGLPVLRDGELLGMLGASQLRQVRRGRWPTTRAADVMVGPPALPVLQPEAALWTGLETLQRSGLDGLPVMRGPDLLGVLTRRGVAAAIQARLSRAGALAAALRAGRRGRGGRPGRGPDDSGPGGVGGGGIGADGDGGTGAGSDTGRGLDGGAR
ncbi:MAG TPA: site-2 protease family protein [Candidatus Limnocylindrales bacterium]